MSSINVEVKVDETEIDKVEVGQEAKIKVDTFGDKELVGKVSQKTPFSCRQIANFRRTFDEYQCSGSQGISRRHRVGRFTRRNQVGTSTGNERDRRYQYKNR